MVSQHFFGHCVGQFPLRIPFEDNGHNIFSSLGWIFRHIFHTNLCKFLIISFVLDVILQIRQFSRKDLFHQFGVAAQSEVDVCVKSSHRVIQHQRSESAQLAQVAVALEDGCSL